MSAPKLTREEMKEAIAEGVYRAFWQMITNNTHAPCADFYAAVQDGVEKAMAGTVSRRWLSDEVGTCPCCQDHTGRA